MKGRIPASEYVTFLDASAEYGVGVSRLREWMYAGRLTVANLGRKHAPRYMIARRYLEPLVAEYRAWRLKTKRRAA